MATMLLSNCDTLVTMNDARDELCDVSIYADNGVITQIGPRDTLPASADSVIDLSQHVVIPGLINTACDFTRCAEA